MFRALFLATAVVPMVPALAASSDTIVVTGQLAKTRVEVKKAAAQFVRMTADYDHTGQNARRSRYCPRIIGIADARAAQMVLDRILDAGDAAGLPRPAAKCAGDLAVVFTGDGDTLMRALQRARFRLFATTEMEKDRELFDSGRAVRWWYNGSVRGADSGRTAQTASIGDTMGYVEVPSLSVWSSSLIETTVRSVIDGTVVVVDVNKAAGFPLDAVASYAAMVSFARINAREVEADAPSILAIFSGADRATVRRTLTGWDRAYLGAMYKLPVNRPAWTQRGLLRAALVAAATQPAAPER